MLGFGGGGGEIVLERVNLHQDWSQRSPHQLGLARTWAPNSS